MVATAGGPVIKRYAQGITPPRIVTATKPGVWSGPQGLSDQKTPANPPAGTSSYDFLASYGRGTGGGGGNTGSDAGDSY